MTTSKKTPVKAPQDRKPKAEKIVRPQDVPGFELLKSIDEVPVWDQAPLLGLVRKLHGSADAAGDLELEEHEAIPLLGQIAKAMLPFAHSEKEFTKFCTGREALQRVMDLATAWVAVLGEEKSSDDS
jgi:hypothetical protein